MTQMMFYERPVALNRERHKALRLAPAANHYAFATGTNAVPIASSEFAEATRDYPIVFVGQEGGPFNVAALVGLRDRQNLMVDAQGQWAAGCYVPAFARRYPFVLAKTEGDDKLTVCIDEVYPGLGTDKGEALFGADGVETPYLKRVLDFLQLFHAETQRTTIFATRLKELGLLVPKVINVERGGERQSVGGLWIVDAAKLRGIDDARVVELFRAGYLSWIEAHLLSLGSLGRLVARLDDAAKVSDERGAIPGEVPPAAPDTPTTH
jgi:hypothetical protein